MDSLIGKELRVFSNQLFEFLNEGKCIKEYEKNKFLSINITSFLYHYLVLLKKVSSVESFSADKLNKQEILKCFNLYQQPL